MFDDINRIGGIKNKIKMNEVIVKKICKTIPTCDASLLTTSSCLLLNSGVPGQLPPPLPPPSFSPPLPKEF